MPKAILSAEAEADLREIVRFIARDNLAAAISWARATKATCRLLATQPNSGERIETNRFGLVRRHVAGNYVIYFRPNKGGIEVVRVVHAARDQGKLI